METKTKLRLLHLASGATAALAAPFLATAALAGPPIALVQPAAMVAISSASCANPSVMDSPPTGLTVQATKSAAILGGEMSALDRIRMQQAQPETALAVTVADTVIEDLAPAAGGIRTTATQSCGERTMPGLASVSSDGLNRFTSEDFLASKRVRIGKTNFDRDWRRVSRENLRGTLKREFGRRTAPDMETIESINHWVNREISYVEDRDLFRKADYWAGARRTLRLGKGDCEDIAITKLQLLAAAGFSRDDMFLTIARDRVRNTDHALLLVRVNGRFVILDNATDEVLDGTLSHDYMPVLSFNNGSAWLHGF